MQAGETGGEQAFAESSAASGAAEAQRIAEDTTLARLRDQLLDAAPAPRGRLARSVRSAGRGTAGKEAAQVSYNELEMACSVC